MSNKKQWMEGELDWFDELSGNGFIRSKDNELFYVHKTAFEESPKKIAKSKSKKVKFKVYEDVSTKQVEKVTGL